MRIPALIGVFLISWSAIFVKLSAVSATTSAFFRVAYAVPVLWAWHLIDQRRTRRSRLRLKHLRFAWSAGILLGFDLFFWHRAIHLIGSGLATVLGNLQVVVVAGLGWLLFNERPHPKALMTLPVILLGVVLISGLGSAEAYGEAPVLGVIMGALTALSYGLFILLFRAANENPMVGAIQPLREASTAAATTVLMLGLALEPVAFDLTPHFPAHGWLMALAVLCQCAGWLLIGKTLPKLPAFETALLLLLQPVSTLILGYIIFSERLSLLQVGGVVLVLTGIVGLTWARIQTKKIEDGLDD